MSGGKWATAADGRMGIVTAAITGARRVSGHGRLILRRRFPAFSPRPAPNGNTHRPRRRASTVGNGDSEQGSSAGPGPDAIRAVGIIRDLTGGDVRAIEAGRGIQIAAVVLAAHRNRAI